MLACGPTPEEGEDMSNRRYDQDNQRWYDSPGHVFAQGGSEARDVNLGWQTEIRAPEAGAGQFGLSTLVSHRHPWLKVAEVSLTDFFGEDVLITPGAIVLTLETTVKTYPAGEGVNYVVPLVARIEQGSGGASIEYEADALRAVIPVHAPYIRVLVNWDTLDANNTAWLDNPNDWIPETLTVKVNLQRSFSKGNATRSYLASLGSSLYYPVPPFSSCFSILSPEPLETFLDGSIEQVSWGSDPDSGIVLDSIGGTTAPARFIKNGCCRKTHPMAGNVTESLVIDGGEAVKGTVVHTLGF